VQLPRGARLNACRSDVSRTGCYIDTLNPIPQGSQGRLRIPHDDEIMKQKRTLKRWLEESNPEF